MIVFCLCLISCNSYFHKGIKPFDKFYDLDIPRASFVSDPDDPSGTLLSLSARNMPFMAFARWLSDNSSVGIVYESRLDSLKISSEFKKASADEIIKSIARRFSLDVVCVGKTYFLGELKPEDRGLLVRKVRGYGAEDLRGAIAVFLSDNGKVNVYPDGTCIVSDRETILKRIDDMLTNIENSLDSSWIVQLFLVSMRSGALKKAGVKVKPSGELAYNVSQVNDDFSKFFSQGYDINAELDLGFNADFAEYFATPMFLLRNGVTGHWSEGESTPIPEKTVSNEGTVTTSGYTYVESGLIINVTVRDSKGGAVLHLDLTDSVISGYVEAAPILAKNQYKSETVLKSNSIYLVGELKRKKNVHALTDFLSYSGDSGENSYQIWCRVYKIAGAALASPSEGFRRKGGSADPGI